MLSRCDFFFVLSWLTLIKTERLGLFKIKSIRHLSTLPLLNSNHCLEESINRLRRTNPSKKKKTTKKYINKFVRAIETHDTRSISVSHFLFFVFFFMFTEIRSCQGIVHELFIIVIGNNNNNNKSLFE